MGKKSRRNRNRSQEANAPRHLIAPTTTTTAPRTRQPNNIPQSLLSELYQYVTPELIDAVLARGVTERLNSKQALNQYFLDFLSGGVELLEIIIPLLQGLHFGPPSINARVRCSRFIGHDDSPTLLHWACQWRFLQNFGWRAQDEMVDMIIRAGADVNATLRNETSPLFFAVKYATIETLDLLLAAGANIQQLDTNGRTCLYNALEHPSSAIVKRLLEHLPATETSEAFEGSTDGDSFMLTMPDRIVEMLINSSTLISWTYFGPPSADALSESLILLRQKGGRFSQGSESALSCLGMLFRKDVVLKKSLLNGPEVFEEVAKTLVGSQIPQAFRPPPIQDDEDLIDEVTELSMKHFTEKHCQICHENTKKAVELYCGHLFCRNCIINFGKEESGSHCPICRCQLCQDIHICSSYEVSGQQKLGLDHSPACFGPKYMTNEQVSAEARFEGIYSRWYSNQTMREKVLEEIKRGHVRAAESHLTMMQMQGQPNEEVFNTINMDLAAGMSIIQGSSDSFISPAKGPVCIEVSVRGVPLVARISNRSFYTIVGETVVEQLRLRRIDSLQTNKLVDTLTAKRLKGLTFTCLEPFTIKVGNIEVTLRNALVASPDPCGEMFGIQLGNDFLLSGAWCPIDVAMEEASKTPSADDVMCMRVDGERAWTIGKSKEMLRYYSHDGKIAHLPLLHFSPFDRTHFLSISLRETVKFDQCFWCCRAFPEGMLVCSTCYEAGETVTYCDERCQKAAFKVHKRTHKAHTK